LFSLDLLIFIFNIYLLLIDIDLNHKVYLHSYLKMHVILFGLLMDIFRIIFHIFIARVDNLFFRGIVLYSCTSFILLDLFIFLFFFHGLLLCNKVVLIFNMLTCLVIHIFSILDSFILPVFMLFLIIISSLSNIGKLSINNMCLHHLEICRELFL
jgi:hypothetical protein